MRNYIGDRKGVMGFGPGAVKVVSEADGIQNLKTRLDLYNHSPTGFEWGYEGSGPAQLALAICADHLRDDVLALRVYQEFKRLVVGRIHVDLWELSGEAVGRAINEILAAREIKSDFEEP